MGNQITERILTELVDFSVQVIKMVDKHQIPRPVKDQLIKSVSSIGANYAEAQNAASKKDFVNKIYIAKKEAAKTIYWLRLVEKLLPALPVQASLDCAQKYVMLLQKIIISCRNTSNKPKATVRPQATGQ